MTYLLIAVVVALALAPLLHFLPSKRQRALARLREAAALQGLFVEFRTPPGADRSPALSTGNIVYYGLRLPATLRSPPPQAAWLRAEEGWRPLGRRGAVPGALDDLPPQVLAASRDGGSCGVYWAEDADEETVSRIAAVLRDWSAGIAADAPGGGAAGGRK